MDYCPNCNKLRELRYSGFCSDWCEQDYDSFMDRIRGVPTKQPKKPNKTERGAK